MKIITTREVARQTKAVFELATKERVSVKRGEKYVNFIVSNEPDEVFLGKEWINEFMSIPTEYRCNPFDISPSGDLFFADKRNLEKISRAMAGKTTRLTKEAQKKLFEID